MTEIYRAGGQLRKVRAAMLVSLPLAAAACWWGWDLFQSYGLRPADGGRLAPLGERLAWLLFLAALGLGLAGGMALYGRIYAAAIFWDEAGAAFVVRTLRFFGTRERRLPAADFDRAVYHDGRALALGDPTVDAPWYFLWFRGRRLPLILDARGELPDVALAARVLKLG